MKKIYADFVKTILPERKQNSNKGDYGKVLNITGSNQYIGAGMLSSIAALKAGCGYSILCSEKNAIEKYKTMSVDLIYKSHENFDVEIVKNIINSDKISAIVLGCGIGQSDKITIFIDKLTNYLSDKNIPVVLDADGLNTMANLDKHLNENFLLTPHPKELAKLLKVTTNEIINNREYYIKLASNKFNCNVILKGHETLISDMNNNIYMNTTGNSALSKAGSGDVLAGLIGGLVAQKIPLINAALIGVYLHGLAADLYAAKYSQYSMLASDIPDYIPLAFKKLINND